MGETGDEIDVSPLSLRIKTADDITTKLSETNKTIPSKTNATFTIYADNKPDINTSTIIDEFSCFSENVRTV